MSCNVTEEQDQVVKDSPLCRLNDLLDDLANLLEVALEATVLVLECREALEHFIAKKSILNVL